MLYKRINAKDCFILLQERLLLSVLPEHVAVKMRQDLGSTDSEQFKKIYMSRHENVRLVELNHINNDNNRN